MSRHEEVLLRTADVLVRVLFLDPGEAVPWHVHTEVEDLVVCLSGRVEVRRRNPDEVAVLSPGERTRTGPGRVHQVSNPDASDSSYLLIQGIGRYDFAPVK